MISHIYEAFPRNKISVYPDASGASRKTVNASVSDIALLERARFNVCAPKRNPFIKDRVMAANSAFKNKRLLVNKERCPELASCFEQLTYDNNGLPDKSMNVDHLPDAATYPVAMLMPILKPISVVPFRFVV